MGSLKRKSDENPSGESAQKQIKENGSEMVDSEPVTCIHDVSYPEGYVPPHHSAPSSDPDHLEPAKVFPFSLDPFQAEAIKCLENGESVMVNFLIHFDDETVSIYGSSLGFQFECIIEVRLIALLQVIYDSLHNFPFGCEVRLIAFVASDLFDIDNRVILSLYACNSPHMRKYLFTCSFHLFQTWPWQSNESRIIGDKFSWKIYG